MINKILLVAVLLLVVSFSSNGQIISTIAGNGASGYYGDGGPATAAELFNPWGITVEPSGDLYIADPQNKRIRKVIASSGIITTVAGIGISSYSGDGGPATSAEISNSADGVAIDTSGNIYIGDAGNFRIRKITISNGTINTVAGNGIYGFAGDGGAATDAELKGCYGVAVDSTGNMYIADVVNYRIRKVTYSTGIINTIAGNGINGFSGDGGPATSAELTQCYGVVADKYGNVYIEDQQNNRIRKVAYSTGIITTFAGNGAGGFSGDGGPASSAEISLPYEGIALDASGNLYFGDCGNYRIRMVNVSTGIINTIAGNGISGFSGDGGPAINAELDYAQGIGFDGSGNLYLSDILNQRIRLITSVSTGSYSSLTISKLQLNIYPVPNSGLFTVSGISIGQCIELYNYTGQLLSSKIADNPTMNFDVSNNANGIYLIRVLSQDGSIVATKKVLKTE